jgi:hypothetical protein
MVTLLRAYLRRAYQKARTDFGQRYPGQQTLEEAPADFFGVASKGMSQMRGNGMLCLTETELIFKLLVPSRWIEVPLDSVVKIENPRSFLGKTKGKKLLVVHFRNVEGMEDSAAWLVPDLEAWTNRIQSPQHVTFE